MGGGKCEAEEREENARKGECPVADRFWHNLFRAAGSTQQQAPMALILRGTTNDTSHSSRRSRSSVAFGH